MRVPSRIKNNCNGQETDVPNTVVDAVSFQSWFNGLATTGQSIGQIAITDNAWVWTIVQSNHNCNVSFYDNAQWFEPVCQVANMLPDNPSGTISGQLITEPFANGDKLNGFVPDPNNCSPVIYYAIIARSDTQAIIAQVTANNPTTIHNWVASQGAVLLDIQPYHYYAAVYGECLATSATPASNNILSIGADWNTITWNQLASVKFQGV